MARLIDGIARDKAAFNSATALIAVDGRVPLSASQWAKLAFNSATALIAVDGAGSPSP